MSGFPRAIILSALAFGASCPAAELSPAEALKANLLEVGRSDQVVYAWSTAQGDWREKAPTGFHQTTGDDPLVVFCEFCSVIGFWQPEEFYRENRRRLKEQLKREFRTHRSVPFVTWHMENPYFPAGYSKCRPAWFRRKSEGYPAEHLNVVREILDNRGGTCGTGGKNGPSGKSFRNPRAWFDWQLDQCVAFCRELVDDGGRRIPVAFRLFHECECDGFWWSLGDTTPQDLIALFRYAIDRLRHDLGKENVLFCYGPDRYWDSLTAGAPGRGGYLVCYPGDDYIDILGFDDYGFGTEKPDRPQANYEATLKRMRIVSEIGRRRNKACGIFESSAKGTTNFYSQVRRILHEKGVDFALWTTYDGPWTFPASAAGMSDMKEFLAHTDVLTAHDGVDLTRVPRLVPKNLKLSAASRREDAMYHVGETVEFVVTAKADDRLATSGRVEVKLDAFGTNVLRVQTHELAKGNPFVVTGKLDEPGFLRVRVKGPYEETCAWSVAVDPTGIRKGSPRPDDFDAYWQAEREKLDRTVPADVKLTRIAERSTKDFDFYRLSLATYKRRIYGYLSVPTDRSRAPYPVVFSVAAGGFGEWTNNMSGRADRICVFFSVFPWAPHWDWKELGLQTAYENMNRISLIADGNEYPMAGIGREREKYFFYPVILGLDRAVSWVASRPDVDRTRFWYSGISQGGGLGLCLAGLNSSISRAAIYVPGLTDAMGFLKGRNSGWPRLLETCSPKLKDKAMENAPYFDAANFASCIRCPIRVVVGFTDVTCPPCAVYATYNEIPVADKEIVHVLGGGHNDFWGKIPRIDAWLTR